MMTTRSAAPTLAIHVAVVWTISLLPSCRGGGDDAAVPMWVVQDRSVYHGIPSRIEFALAGDDPTRETAAASAWAEFSRIGEVANAFSSSSEVGILNLALKVGPIAVSPDMDVLLRVSREVWSATDGSFDPTVWPLKMLWREAARSGRPPPAADVASAQARVGLRRVRPAGDGAWTFDAPDAALDFGGIAKGYAVDRVTSVLRDAGAPSGLVQCGGEISAWGEAPEGGPWRMGVRDPLAPDRMTGVISWQGAIALSTSGSYEQPVRVGEREFHHIFDPHTGQPIDTVVLGVTVAVLDGDLRNTRADALASGLSVLGPEKGMALAEALPGVAALFIVRDSAGGEREVLSSRMRGIFTR